MMKHACWTWKALLVLGLSAGLSVHAGATGDTYDDPAAKLPVCAADPTWITNPSLPTEIPGGGENFCQFYQFAWQTFLYLVSPSGNAGGDRNFEVQTNYPTLRASGIDSCKAPPAGPQLFVRTAKPEFADGKFIIPERIDQAGDNATIYDQNGNVVFYDVRFDRGLCSASDSGDLPAGTTELKSSWRELKDGETGYFTMQAVIVGAAKKPTNLGLIGFHLFRTTEQHPEGVWMTWEHASNVPDCLKPAATPPGGWSFTSSQCAQCLATSSNGTLGCPSCNFNEASKNPHLMGTPSEICRVYRDGTAPKDHKAAENFRDVTSLNHQLVGPNGLLAKADPTLDMGIWQNYFNVGGLWVSDPSQSASTSNQRGSLQLSNTTMETTFQGDFKASGSSFVRTGAVNCFGCHNYVPGQTATSGLSHIFGEIHGKSSNDQAAEAGGHTLRFVTAVQPQPAHAVTGQDR